MTTPPVDLFAAALERRRTRAWLARAGAAPIPPPPAPPARSVSVAELDTAVADGLARGHSSLEQRRRDMAKGMIKLAPAPATSRASCPVCGLALERAHPDHSVCRHCAGDADRSRATLDTRRGAIDRQHDAAEQAWCEAFAALSDKDAARWEQIERLMVATDEASKVRYASIRAALLDPADARVTDDLRRLYGTDEVRYWAREGAAAKRRQVEVAATQLEDCLAALAAEAAAHGPTVEVVGSRGDRYRVAVDGSWCSCPGFKFRGECKHAKAQKERCEEWEFEGITPSS